jgi:hypothetical protein
MLRHATCLLIAALGAACAPEYPLCKNDAQCRIGEVCVDGHCARCAADKDCLEGERCLDGACQKPLERCASAADCASGMVCLFELCSGCFEDAQCGPGRVCVEGRCAECGSGADCPPGARCVGGECTEPAEAGKADAAAGCMLSPVYFGFDSALLTGAARAGIEAWLECLDRDRTYTLVGRADQTGDAGYNLSLGLERARAVRDHLVSLGFPSKNLVVTTAGSDASGGDDAKDRRVDIL